jgi:hypothetical protein
MIYTRNRHIQRFNKIFPFISICSNRKKIELNDLFIFSGTLEDEDLSLRNSIFNFHKVYLILS